MIIRVFGIIAALTMSVMGSTNAVYPVWQPISLHGTDVTSVPGKESNVEFGAVMSRPLVVSGALPEALVYAIALGHEMQSIGMYDKKECNLLALYNVGVEPTMNEDKLTVVFDLSKASAPEEMEVNLRGTIVLGIEALKLTLAHYAEAHLHKDITCVIRVEGLTEKNQTYRNLGEKFVVRAPEEEVFEEPLPEEE